MMNIGPPHQQNTPATPENRHRSPQIKKSQSSPAWGSGAIASPTHVANNRPTLLHSQFTSPPPYGGYSTPPHCVRPHQFPPRVCGPPSPRFPGNNFGNQGSNNHTFRTPQPMYRTPCSPQKSWSCDNNYRHASKRLNMKSPRRDFNSNPGGSNSIDQYYHPSMLEDPWLSMTPVPVTHSPSATT